ncbi:MAG: MarR family transcriptional regulator [Candidatus Krumholzibacteriia bacterium]
MDPDTDPHRTARDPGAEGADSDRGRRILHALRRIIREVDLYSRKLVILHEITGPQLVCLNTAVEHGPVSVTELASRVQLSKSTVVRILDRLEARDLVTRSRVAGDRRRVLVTATPAGLELSARAPYSEQHPLRAALRRLAPERQEQVAALVEELVGLMDTRDSGQPPAPAGEQPWPVATASRAAGRR